MLNTIRDNAGSSHRRMRVGRGIGSGKGKTCGRGFKGQKSRCGVSINGFEGGQMPIYRRLPKRGFRSRRAYTAILNLDTLQRAIDKGILPSSINIQKLKEIRLIPNYTKKIRILGNGNIVAPISLVADGVSKTAIQKIELVNGSVDIIDCKNKKRQ